MLIEGLRSDMLAHTGLLIVTVQASTSVLAIGHDLSPGSSRAVRPFVRRSIVVRLEHDVKVIRRATLTSRHSL
jgi:hypothetical protein